MPTHILRPMEPHMLGTVIWAIFAIACGTDGQGSEVSFVHAPDGAQQTHPEKTPEPLAAPEGKDTSRLDPAKMLVEYYHQMSVPKPFVVREGDEFQAHQAELRKEVLKSVGLWPLPERVPLDVRQSPPLDHPWCTVRRIYYQLWPEVYASGLLFMPKELTERPAPAILCPHGHWKDGNAHAEVQKRCLNLARMGYVTFSSTQNHYEDLYLGVSHQTLMIWNNMRALDYLESLPEVDAGRIGVAGASGGGLQTQMLAALDPRVQAATIVGLTCNFREIMFPERHHCTCNHFPGVMQFTDHPEISALAFPTPVQFLTMNDWTKSFQQDNFPTISKLYAANGLSDHVDCQYYDTPHSYDKDKRERTTWWMERWLRGKENPEKRVAEPEDIVTFPVKTLSNLSTRVAEDQGFSQISTLYRQQRGDTQPALANPADWHEYKKRMGKVLHDLLGLEAELPRQATGPKELSKKAEGDLLVERVGYPSEGGILVPTIVIRPERTGERLPVVVMFAPGGKESLMVSTGLDSPTEIARQGSLVVLPDVRCYGQMASTGGQDTAKQETAWERNGIVWGRPVPGMACTDILGVLDGISGRPDADMSRVKLASRGSGGLGVAVLLAAALEERIGSVDVDLNGACFQKRNLPLVSCVLQYGDVLQWAALVADRKLTIGNVPSEAGDLDWLTHVFALMDNRDGLEIGAVDWAACPGARIPASRDVSGNGR